MACASALPVFTFAFPRACLHWNCGGCAQEKDSSAVTLRDRREPLWSYCRRSPQVVTACATYGGGVLASKLLVAPLDRWQLEQQLSGSPLQTRVEGKETRQRILAEGPSGQHFPRTETEGWGSGGQQLQERHLQKAQPSPCRLASYWLGGE